MNPAKKMLFPIAAMICFGCNDQSGQKNEPVTEPAYFTGEIAYDYSYESHVLNVDSLVKLKPYRSNFRYDLGNYQSQFIDKDTFTYFYSGSLNKCVSETNSQKNYECEDYSTATDSILSFKVYDTDEKVLGYKCRILEYQSKIFRNKYYVSTDLKIAPATYQKHLAYNWKFYGEQTGGGLILKLEHRFKNYVMKGIASGIVQQQQNYKALQVDEAVFNKACLNIQ
jgi:hypothetical protein